MLEEVIKQFALMHPFFVHFPIAFLYAYGLLALVRAIFTFESLLVRIVFVEKVLILLGFPLALLAYLAGDALSETMGETKAIELHEAFASFALFVSALIFTLYFAESFWNILKKATSKNERLSMLLAKVEKSFIFERLFESFKKTLNCRFAVSFFAVTLLLSLSITGALGAGIAHGQGVDAIVSFVYKIFGF